MKELNIFLSSSKIAEKRYDEDEKKEFEIVENHHIYGSVNLNREIKGILLDEALSVGLAPYAKKIVEKNLPLQSMMPEIYKVCSNFVAGYGAKVEKIEMGHDKSFDIGENKGGFVKIDSAKFISKTPERTK